MSVCLLVMLAGITVRIVNTKQKSSKINFFSARVNHDLLHVIGQSTGDHNKNSIANLPTVLTKVFGWLRRNPSQDFSCVFEGGKLEVVYQAIV